MEYREKEQSEDPIIQGEMVSKLLHHLYTHKSMGPGRIHPRVQRELVEIPLRHFPSFISNPGKQGGSS